MKINSFPPSLSVINEVFDTFFNNIGHNKLKKSSIAAILIIGTSPIPLAASLLIFAMQQSAVAVALDDDAISLFHKVAISFSLLCMGLGALGYYIKNHQAFSYVYILIVAQLFAIGTFCLCYFLGVFTSPILLTILMSTGVGAVIFDKQQLLYALFSVFILACTVSFLQIAGDIKLLPFAESLVLAEQYLLEWYLYVYAFMIPILSFIFSAIVRGLMKEFQNKHQELEALALKLAKYLSPQVYSSIFSGSKDVHLETYRKKLTIFFSDLKGFTSITDDLSSEQLSDLLNSYLNEMAIIALKYGGTIDKFVGDSIMIFFGDPESQGEKNDALNCTLMAIAMRERVKELKKGWQVQGILHPMSLRVGINTGYCTVGNFGSDNRIDYTIIGGQVNLASRLQYSANEDCILISHETFGLINNDINCIKKDKISVKGIHRAIQTYEVNDAFHKIKQDKKDIGNKVSEFLQEIDFSKLSDQEKIDILEHIKKES